MMFVGSMYAYGRGGNTAEFKFLILEDEEICHEKYNSLNIVKVWVFWSNRPNFKCGLTFLNSDPAYYLCLDGTS